MSYKDENQKYNINTQQKPRNLLIFSALQLCQKSKFHTYARIPYNMQKRTSRILLHKKYYVK